MPLLYAFRQVEIRFWLLAETRKNILFHHQIPDINIDVHIQKNDDCKSRKLAFDQLTAQ